jgi:hypothetical protein
MFQIIRWIDSLKYLTWITECLQQTIYFYATVRTGKTSAIVCQGGTILSARAPIQVQPNEDSRQFIRVSNLAVGNISEGKSVPISVSIRLQHTILIRRVERIIGVTGIAYKWHRDWQINSNQYWSGWWCQSGPPLVSTYRSYLLDQCCEWLMFFRFSDGIDWNHCCCHSVFNTSWHIYSFSYWIIHLVTISGTVCFHPSDHRHLNVGNY